MRFVGSFFGALVVVGLLLSVGVRLLQVFEPDQAAMVFHEVDLLSGAEQRELADVLGTAPRPGILPPLADIPPVEFRRTVQGFVQLEVAVSASGRVEDARVLGSTLPPSYGQRAIDMVRERRYTPDMADGQPVAGRRLEVVEFRMDAPVSRAASP